MLCTRYSSSMNLSQRTKLGELVAQRIATLGISQVDYATRMGVQKAERLALDALSDALSGVQDAETVYQRQKARYDALTRSSGDQIKRLEKQAHRLTVERDRMLVLYRRGSLDVDRWEAEDRTIGAKLDEVTRELAVFGDAPAREAFATIAEAIDRVRISLAVDPTQARQVLLRLGARVRLRSRGVVRIVWPDHIAPFFDATL